jgi:hypothetical protein
MENNNLFQKAVKSKSKLRLAVFGISGSGKTYTSLELATGMGGKIAVLDTEHGSASKYADRFEFDVAEIKKPFTLEKYIKFIKNAEESGYNVLIIDSLSHGWKELLEEMDKLANAKFSGNTWGAWSEGTPKQNKFIEALLSFNGHIIATMRSKTEWTISVNDKGKTVPKRVGAAPVQGKDIEFEFDMLMEMTEEHLCRIIKDRTSKYQDEIMEKPNRKFGEQLIAWLNEGTDKPAKSFPQELEDSDKLGKAFNGEEITEDTMKEELKKIGLPLQTKKYLTDTKKWSIKQIYNYCADFNFDKATITNQVNKMKSEAA